MDDNTPYVIADNIDDLIKSIEEASTALFQWFDNNLLKSNPDKCHLLISSNENVTFYVGECETTLMILKLSLNVQMICKVFIKILKNIF